MERKLSTSEVAATDRCVQETTPPLPIMTVTSVCSSKECLALDPAPRIANPTFSVAANSEDTMNDILSAHGCEKTCKEEFERETGLATLGMGTDCCADASIDTLLFLSTRSRSNSSFHEWSAHGIYRELQPTLHFQKLNCVKKHVLSYPRNVHLPARAVSKTLYTAFFSLVSLLQLLDPQPAFQS